MSTNVETPLPEKTSALTELSEVEELFRSMVREFAQKEIGPLVRKMDQDAKIDPALLPKLFELGLMGIEIPESYGGSGASFFMAALAVEEISRVDASLGVCVDVQNTLVNNAVMRFGNDEQKTRYLPRLARDTVGAYALSEPDYSSWYFYRYCDPRSDTAPFDAGAVRYWAPIDFYSGGVEHAILHLIYSRFFCKVLRDLGLVEHDEPFTRLLTQGMVLRDGAVMSKSKGNVVDPDEMTATCGADALRLYEMFVAPPEKEIEWTDAGLDGSARFLARVWRLVMPFAETCAVGGAPPFDGLELGEAERGLRRKTHDTIRRVSEDLDPRVHLNTAVSALMELVNDLYAFCEGARIGPFASDPASPAAEAGPAALAVVREAIEGLVLMLSPFTPHLSEELWEALGHDAGVEAAGWPGFDADVARAETLVLPVQVNGKVRARLTVALDTAEDELRRLALAQPQVQTHIAGRTVARVVVVPGRLVSIVAKS